MATKGRPGDAATRGGAPPETPLLEELRQRIRRIGRTSSRRKRAVLGFRTTAIDNALPEGGLAHGALHEVHGGGPDVEHGAAAALLVAGLLSQVRGMVLWVLERRDLFAPALASVGLPPDRVIYVEAGKPAAVVRVTLTASRRLQLAAEASGVTGFALRRSPRHDDPALSEPSAALTRWRVSAHPSPPPLPQAPDTIGLGRARWRLDLTRCRGGEGRSWIVEACDAQGRLAVVTELADGQAAPEHARTAAGDRTHGDVAA
jgi:protein ImuA